MARYRVAAGAHYARPFATWPWLGARRIERLVTFAPECAYFAPAYNGQDVNKLFGLSFGFGGVHHHSARFGWRWSQGDQCIELLAYVYTAGTRNWDEQRRFPVVAQLKPGRAVRLRIEYLTDEADPRYVFTVADENGAFIWDEDVPAPQRLPGYGLTHGLYFGGALPAPHAMSVRINRL